jgi:hypothetical protein
VNRGVLGRGFAFLISLSLFSRRLYLSGGYIGPRADTLVMVGASLVRRDRACGAAPLLLVVRVKGRGHGGHLVFRRPHNLGDTRPRQQHRQCAAGVIPRGSLPRRRNMQLQQAGMSGDKVLHAIDVSLACAAIVMAKDGNGAPPVPEVFSVITSRPVVKADVGSLDGPVFRLP